MSIVCSCNVVVGGVSFTSPDGTMHTICERHWFDAEVERRAGASREEMLGLMRIWQQDYPNAEPWPSAGIVPHVVRWLRNILGGDDGK